MNLHDKIWKNGYNVKLVNKLRLITTHQQINGQVGENIREIIMKDLWNEVDIQLCRIKRVVIHDSIKIFK